MSQVPKLRFSEFTDQWKSIPFDSIAERITRKNKDNETDLPLTISSIDGLIDQRTYFKKAVASKDMSGYYLLKKGEFTYNKSYSIGFEFGSIKRLDKYDMGALSTLYICFVLKGNIDSDFMVDYFDSHKWYREIYEICAEGARNHGLLNVSTEDFFKIKINVPNALEEQRKITDFLSKVDERIAVQENIIFDLENQKKGLIQKLFNQEIRFKADDGSDYPKWEKGILGEMGEFLKGASLSKADITDVGTPLLLYGELYTTYKEITDIIFRRTDKIVEQEYYSKVGDVVIPTSGESAEEISTATCVLYKGAILAGDINIYRSNIVDGRIISYILNFVKKYEIAKLAQGKSIVHIQAKELSKLEIMYPCKKEQLKIADFLLKFDKKIEIERKILEDWQQIKKGLLQQMFV